ncbi:hypothetical protein [Streptomyces sp. NPDC048191]|uniref:hypothetical protein n=1 Tax=Streptomyces sp. NPDC048191 TaxID=3155484 RepID=UPI0033E4B6AE
MTHKKPLSDAWMHSISDSELTGSAAALSTHTLHAATRPDLNLRGFRPSPPTAGTRWCGEITYIPAEAAWPYYCNGACRD